MKKKSKTYDAVKEARKIKEQLSQKYWNNPDVLKEDMKKIAQKYSRYANKAVAK